MGAAPRRAAGRKWSAGECGRNSIGRARTALDAARFLWFGRSLFSNRAMWPRRRWWHVSRCKKLFAFRTSPPFVPVLCFFVSGAEQRPHVCAWCVLPQTHAAAARRRHQVGDRRAENWPPLGHHPLAPARAAQGVALVARGVKYGHSLGKYSALARAGPLGGLGRRAARDSNRL